jgi:aspartate oxidase
MEKMEQTNSQKKNNATKTQGKDPVGSVMVLGSGIAGMQSALDLDQ